MSRKIFYNLKPVIIRAPESRRWTGSSQCFSDRVSAVRRLDFSPLLAILAALPWVLIAGVPAIADEAPPPWFDALIDVEPLSATSEEELARHVAAAFLDPATALELPSGLTSDKLPRLIFASLSDGRGPTPILRGAGRGAAEAVRSLLEERDPEAEVSWVKIDVVREVVRETGLSPERPLNLPHDLFGLAFEPEVGAAFLPGELVAHSLVDSGKRLSLKGIAARLDAVSQAEALGRAAGLRSLVAYRFSTSGYFSDGDSLIRLYRDHPVEEVTPDLLLEASRRGGDYLKRAVRRDGRFIYSYRAQNDRVSDRYNILRHAGTIYSMLELYEVTQDQELLEAAERALQFLVEQIESCPLSDQAGGDPEAVCVFEKSFVKLGGNALTVIALAKHAEVTGSNRHMRWIERLVLWMLATQSEDGEFTAHKVHRNGELDDHVSQYYPGEALLALLRASQLRNSRRQSTVANDRWLDAAARGARWLIEVRDREVPDHRLNHDHWLLYALNELYRQRPEPLYLDHARRITSAILGLQNRRPIYPDWLGSYYVPPRSTPTATRSEGLAAAYFMESDFGTPERAAELLDGLKLGARFQLGTQLGPESVLYLPVPQRALGGFRRSLDSYEIRIDYVQHNISALLLLRRILLDAQSQD